MIDRLAVYTTVYPGVEAFLGDWYRSLKAQTDLDFDLWVGVDSLSLAEVKAAMGEDPPAEWVLVRPGATLAQVRQQAWERMVICYEAIVLVDSDDVMHPTRVGAARSALRWAEVSACGLRLVDEKCAPLGRTLSLRPGVDAASVLPRTNVFGLSNSAFRAAALRDCLPIPAETILVDWYLVTRAWLRGQRLAFDSTPRMDYRQHSGNMARMLPPFTPEQVAADTERVRSHFRLVCENLPVGALRTRVAELERTAGHVEMFHKEVVCRPPRLREYSNRLNASITEPRWWSAIAHPELEEMWIAKESA